MQLSKFSISSDLLSFIGQNYLKNVLCIKKLFYHHKDDELQKILFGVVLYKHNQFPKTTIPFDFILPELDNRWVFYSVPLFMLKKHELYNATDHMNIYNEVTNRMVADEYQIFITFEKKKKLLIKLEYEPVIYNDSINSYTLSHKQLKIYIPKVYKRIKKEIYEQIIN